MLISSSVIEVLMIPGVPLWWWVGGWGRGGWMGVGVGMGVWGCPMHEHMCMNAHTCLHTCMHMHVKYDKHGCLHVGGHLQFLYMYTCVSMHVHACVHVWGHPSCPQMPPDPSPTCPLPGARGSPKHQNSVSLECCVL